MKKEDNIKTIVKEFLNKMGFLKTEVDIKRQEQSPVLIVDIKISDLDEKTQEEKLNPDDFQRVLRLIVNKQVSEAPLFLIDINGYRKKREKFLKDLSKELADEVAKTKRSIMLQPMSSFERRIIHLELAERPDVTTESIGEGPERRIVIRPYP